jgi:hypothetical protein
VPTGFLPVISIAIAICTAMMVIVGEEYGKHGLIIGCHRGRKIVVVEGWS